ncbi:MAG: hypothetical protein JXB39_14645 [Deltaproteobacteria bacterium]|nr:hypothetical protein [Deltaproteobacteria bacterium]
MDLRPGTSLCRLALAAVLLTVLAGRSDAASRIPSEADARAVVEALVSAVRTGTLAPDQVERWFGAPPSPFRDAPDGPAFDRLRIAAALAPDGPLGSLLATHPEVEAVVSGPDYVRVVLATRPATSLVLRREGGRTVVRRWETTHCGACSESERFVQGLFADLEEGRIPRLVPHLDLRVSPDTLGLDQGTWRFTWATRNDAAGYLRHVLAGAEVQGARGDEVQVALSDRVETWRVRYQGHRWMLDYDELPSDSPLRLAPDEGRWWRDRDGIRRDAMAWWRPRSVPTPDGGLLRATSAVAVGFDVGRDRWTIAVQRLDRLLASLFFVEEDGSVAARHPLPAWPERVPEVPLDWPQWWQVEISPRHDRVFLSADNRAWIVPLGGPAPVPVQRLGFGRIRAAAWTADARAVLVGDERGTVTRVDGATGVASMVLQGTAGEVVGVVLDGDRPVLAWTGGEVRILDPETLETERTTCDLCCGSVSGLALPPGRGEALVACGPDAGPPRAAAWVSTVSDDPPEHFGDAWLGRGAGVSVSPDGRWAVLPSATGSAAAVLCEARSLEPAAFFSHVDLVDVAWNARSDVFLALRTDGTAVQWRVADLLGGVPDEKGE